MAKQQDDSLSRFGQQGLYGGAQPQATAIQTPNLTALARPADTMGADFLAKGTQAQVAAAKAFEEAAIERNNYIIDQTRQAAILDITNNANNELQRRLSLADGASGAFYDANGAFREEDYQSFKESVTQKLAGMTNGYIGDKAQAAAATSQNEVASRLLGQMDSAMAKNMAPRAGAAVRRNAAALQAMGDFAGAQAVLSAAPDYALDPTTRDLLLQENDNNSILWSAQNAYNTGDNAGLLGMLNDREIRRRLTPENFAKLLRMTEQNSASDGERITTNADGSVTVKSPELPYGCPSYVYDWFIQPHDEKDGRWINEMKTRLSTMVKSLVYSEDATAMKERCRTAGKVCGMQEYVDELLKQNDKQLKGVGTYNIDDHMKGWDVEHALVSSYLTDELTTMEQDLSSLYKDPARLKDTKKKSFKQWQQKERKLQDELTQKRHEIAMAKKKAVDEIKGAFDRWKLAQESSGHEPTNKESAVYVANLIDEAINRSGRNEQSASLSIRQYIDNMEAQEAQMRLERKNAYDKAAEDAKATDAKRRETDNAIEQLPQQIQHGNLDTGLYTTANLPDTTTASIIYVSKDSPLAGQKLRVGYNNCLYDAECRAVDGLEQPALSTRLRQQLGMLRDTQPKYIHFNGQGHAAISNSSSIPQNKMGQFLLKAEARRDQNGNLKVYNTPAADGSGKEIAGLSEKHDPAEYAHAKALLDAGKPEEAEEYCLNTILKKTQRSANLLSAAGKQSPAVENMLRNIEFNMGYGGLIRVLERTGMPKGYNPSSYLAAMIDNMGEAATCISIDVGRRAQYDGIMTANPAKTQFRAGWYNRATNDLNNSLFFLQK